MIGSVYGEHEEVTEGVRMQVLKTRTDHILAKEMEHGVPLARRSFLAR